MSFEIHFDLNVDPRFFVRRWRGLCVIVEVDGFVDEGMAGYESDRHHDRLHGMLSIRQIALFRFAVSIRLLDG